MNAISRLLAISTTSVLVTVSANNLVYGQVAGVKEPLNYSNSSYIAERHLRFSAFHPIDASSEVAPDQLLRFAEEQGYELVGTLSYDANRLNNSNGLASINYVYAVIATDRTREGRMVAVLFKDYLHCHEPTGDVYVVPAGFETDFLSIPSLAQTVFQTTDYIQAAIVHDWMYAVGETGQRPAADRVFLDILRETNASWIESQIMHVAVRLGGDDAFGDQAEWRFYNPNTMAIAHSTPFRKPESPVAVRLQECPHQSDQDSWTQLGQYYGYERYWRRLD